MRKLILALGILILFFQLPKSSLAQSPIQCGLLGEQCCNLAGNHNSCKEGAICENNICVDDPNSDITPIPRGVADPGTNASPLKGNCIDTAIGCIPINDQSSFITFIFKWAIGIAGGIAFILIVISAFQIMTSQGDPKRMQAGKELLTSAIMGLILLIFSVFILRIVGVEILNLPGLS